MYWSKAFIPTLREVPQEAESISHQLMLRAGLVRMLMAGAYIYLPFGLQVLRNIEKIIREEMASCGAIELLLPALQPLELWQKTGRDEAIGEVMIRFVDRRGRKVCLGPTHEEVITELVKNYIFSYRQLPLVLYQIQTKFRDELRPRFGLVRACEFIMKDAYSFDKDQNGLNENYERMLKAYHNIFKRCGLDFLTLKAESGVMGGSVSHEFMVPAESGEDIVALCPKCHRSESQPDGEPKICPECNSKMQRINTIEVGHIFQLGTKYSESLGANFLNEAGIKQPIIMGCYGIGVSRLVAAIIEQNHDQQGIIWPKKISPFDVIILALDTSNAKIMAEAELVYRTLGSHGMAVLFDDRDERAGVKFNDADLLGIPLQIIIGKDFLNSGMLEIKNRRDGVKVKAQKDSIGELVDKMLS